ncbi:MAG: Uma2 family endonuclease [Xenococcaceae cyanobacterium]
MNNTITYKWSIAKWHELVETGVLEDQPVELLEGEIIQMSPEGVPHTYTNRCFADYLREMLKGLAYISENHPITLDNSEPEPDIAIVRLPATIYREHHPYAEDIYWLIEISKNTLTIDLTTKANLYARNGIPEYWVIDLVNRRLIVHTQPQSTHYDQLVEYNVGVVSTQAFPEIKIALDQLLLF